MASNALTLDRPGARGWGLKHSLSPGTRFPSPTFDSRAPETWEEAGPFEYLKNEVFPRLAAPPFGEIEVEKLSHQKPVYLFREKGRDLTAVGKFFHYDAAPEEAAWRSAEKEYFNLRLLRGRCRMGSGGCRVVAPLGKNRELSALLVVENAPGRTLDCFLAEAVYQHRSQQLFEKLAALAEFFAKLHHNGETRGRVSLALPRLYLSELLSHVDGSSACDREIAAIEECAGRWWDSDGLLTADREVIVHGDATPTNFLLHGEEVVGIDLERMKRADRCWDLGFIAAELKHHFMWRAGDGWAAEPFIGHFLWQYATRLGDAEFFEAVTRRIPLYMALGLLRIARNPWLDYGYRKTLISEARRCLKYGLSFSTATAPS